VTHESKKPPDLLVEQLALGELDEARAAPLRAQLEREVAEGGPDRLAEIATSNAEILADYPPERVAEDIRRRINRAEAAGRSRSSLWLLAPTLAAAAVLIWVVTRDDEPTTVAHHDTSATLVDDGEPEPTRIKGGVEPHLVIDRQTASGHERLAAGELIAGGDLLQVSYVPAGRREGVIVSIDGAGVVTLHHPSDAAAEPSLSEGNEVPLAHAYELDEAPDFERFVFVTRDGGPASVAEVMAAAEQLASNLTQAESAPLSLPGEGWMQHSILLRKPKHDAPTPAEGDP
jgi:hypothetical protein